VYHYLVVFFVREPDAVSTIDGRDDSTLVADESESGECLLCSISTAE
jgi:hypothetical protein